MSSCECEEPLDCCWPLHCITVAYSCIPRAVTFQCEKGVGKMLLIFCTAALPH